MNCPNPTTSNRVSNIYQKKLISQNSIDHSTRSIKSEESNKDILKNNSNLRDNEKYSYDKILNLMKQDKLKELNKNKVKVNETRILDEKTNLFEAFKVEHHFPIGCGINENTFKNQTIENELKSNENKFLENHDDNEMANKIDKNQLNNYINDFKPKLKLSEIKEDWESICNKNWKFNDKGKIKFIDRYNCWFRRKSKYYKNSR